MRTIQPSGFGDGSQSERPNSAGNHQQIATRLKVLWIDDESLPGDCLARFLEARGFDVDFARTLRSGLAMACADRYAAILLDLQMPDGHGLDALYDLSRSGEGVPVIVLSAFADLDTAVTAMKLGAASVKAKPCEGDDLVRAVREIAAARCGLRDPGEPGPRGEQQVVWLGHVCSRLADCTSAYGQRRLLLRTMLHPEISLPAFLGCAEALRHSGTSRELSLALRASSLKHVIMQSVKKGTPSHPKLRAALQELRTTGWRDTGPLLARRFDLSRAYFSHLLQKHTGLGVDEWRRAARMHRALEVTLGTTEHISQIAFQVGYAQASHFTRDFTSTFGVPPTDLRQEWASQ